MAIFPERSRWRILRRSPKVFVPVGDRQIVIPFRPLSTLLIFVLSILSVFLLLRTDLFQVKALEFEFEDSYEELLIRQRIMEEVLARSIFFLNPSAVEAEIQHDFPVVRSVSMEKKLPDKLLIRVSVREPLAIVEDKTGTRFLVDREGLLFRAAAQEDLPVIKLGEDFEGSVGGRLSVAEQGISGYLKTLEVVASKGLEAKAIYLRSKTIELQLSKTLIWLNAEGDVEEQLELLAQILQRFSLSGKTPKAVDLRFSRPVVRL